MGPKGMGFPANGVPNNGWKLYITSLAMVIAAGLFVIARCGSRYWLFKLGWDDAAIVASLCFSIVVSVSMQLAIENGYGMHKADLTTDELRTALKLFFIAQTPYKVSVCLNKVSAILLCLRIFPAESFRISAFVVIGIVVAWSMGGVGATIFQCIPIAGAWDKSVDAQCIDSDAFWVAYAVVNILTDVMVLALPIPSILRLNLSVRERALLCFVFLLGGFVTVTSILRATAVQNSTHNQADSTFNFIERGIWTLVEVNTGIIIACLPILKQPMAKLFPRIFDSITKKGSSYAHHGSSRVRGYNLSNLSAHDSKTGFWNSSARTTGGLSSGADAQDGRKSDEEHIIKDYSVKIGSDRDFESPSSIPENGIEKRVYVEVRSTAH